MITIRNFLKFFTLIAFIFALSVRPAPADEVMKDSYKLFEENKYFDFAVKMTEAAKNDSYNLSMPERDKLAHALFYLGWSELEFHKLAVAACERYYKIVNLELSADKKTLSDDIKYKTSRGMHKNSRWSFDQDADAIDYFLALAYQEAGRHDSAKRYFDSFLENCPSGTRFFQYAKNFSVRSEINLPKCENPVTYFKNLLSESISHADENLLIYQIKRFISENEHRYWIENQLPGKTDLFHENQKIKEIQSQLQQLLENCKIKDIVIPGLTNKNEIEPYSSFVDFQGECIKVFLGDSSFYSIMPAVKRIRDFYPHYEERMRRISPEAYWVLGNTFLTAAEKIYSELKKDCGKNDRIYFTSQLLRCKLLRGNYKEAEDLITEENAASENNLYPYSKGIVNGISRFINGSKPPDLNEKSLSRTHSEKLIEFVYYQWIKSTSGRMIGEKEIDLLHKSLLHMAKREYMHLTGTESRKHKSKKGSSSEEILENFFSYRCYLLSNKLIEAILCLTEILENNTGIEMNSKEKYLSERQNYLRSVRNLKQSGYNNLALNHPIVMIKTARLNFLIDVFTFTEYNMILSLFSEKEYMPEVRLLRDIVKSVSQFSSK